MTDFQSFLFQNMQMIGLEEEDGEPKVSKHIAVSSSPSSSNSSQKGGQSIKALGTTSASTTDTYLSNMNRKNMDALKTINQDDPYDLNNQEPKFVKKKLKPNINSSVESFPDPPADIFTKKDQMFESKVMDLDMNYVLGNDEPDQEAKSDSKSLSSPESNVKFSFKSSTPIINGQDKKYDSSSSQSDREVKSPKVARKKSLNCRKFSPCRSIFDKKTMSKASLNSFNEEESFVKNNYRPNRSLRDDLCNSNYFISSRIFDKRKFNIELKSNTSSESDFNVNSSLESVLMEPYLVKFEQELIKNSKSEVIKDLSNLTQSIALEQPVVPAQKNLFQKYFSEIKNLTLKKKTSPVKKSLGADLFKKIDHVEELVYDEQEEEYQSDENTQEDLLLNKENLKDGTKTHIPWQNLDAESSDQLLNLVMDNLNQTVMSDDLPLLYSKKGNKISKNQVKRWFELLEKLAHSEFSKSVEKETNQTKSRLYSSKQYLINKKRQFMEKVSKKRSKPVQMDLSQSSSDISKNVSKLYANVVPVEKTPKKRHLDEKKKDTTYENESFVKDKSKVTRKTHPDHFYNEITDLEQRQAVIKNRNKEKERFENTKVGNLSNKNSEILQQIYDYTQESSHDSTSNMIFKKNIAAIAKLKSPERKILYNEWFTILKRMEKDPKFDLETLVRTRGRFSDNDKISYRTKLTEKSDKIRTARSEPNFNSIFSNRVGRTRNGMNTTPAVKANRDSDPVASRNNPGSKPTKADLKLTLEKSDINKIKDLLKKKDKSLKVDLTNLKERTNLRKMQHKAELASQKHQKQLLTTHAIISEEFDEDDQDNLKISLNSQINKRATNSSSKLKKNISRNTSNMDESNVIRDLAPDESANSSVNQKNDSKLILRCKKIYTGSETARAFTEVTKMVKGLKIGNKIKNLTNSSSKFIHKAINHGNEEPNESVVSNQPSSSRKKNLSRGVNSETGSQASMTFSSMSEEDLPRRPQNRVERHSGKKEKRSLSRQVEKKPHSKDRSTNGNNSRIPVSPARPPPPKRPPPPRPFSPATSCSSISTNIKKSARYRDFEDESICASPPTSSRKSTRLPPRPKPPSNLPPRPPKSKHRCEESFDEKSIEEEQRFRHKSDKLDKELKHKRNANSSSRQDNKELKDPKKNTPRNSTPVRSPNMTREIKSKSNARKEVSRR